MNLLFIKRRYSNIEKDPFSLYIWVRGRGEQVLGEVEGQLVPGEVEGHQVHGGGGVQSLVQMWQGAPTENRFAVLAKTSATLAEQEL